ncbi:MAG: serine/threonine protein kinase [Aquabacterium sp.]|jgi:Ser/Thr protein kinase RdoA (MazF antagonist)|nr:MAG: serine/threonine protein kinase [Aquabacterium sp.]
MSATPYADLTPDAVLAALDAAGLRGDGRLLQLNSYENRVFQLHLEDGSAVVAKFYRDGRWSDAQILEEHAFAAELVRAEVPVVAPLVLQGASDRAAHTQLLGQPPTLARVSLLRADGTPAAPLRLAVAPRRGGRAPELEDPAVLTWIGRFIGRLHGVGRRQPFAHRLQLSVAATGRGARDWLVEQDILPPTLSATWRAAADEALDLAQAAFDRIPDLRTLRLHGDCHVGNVLWTEAGPHFVDLDDACTGPAVQDLWMLLAGDPPTRQRQLAALLDGYESMQEFDWRELALIEPLRTLRLLHHGAWLARRWADPAFPAAFPWFGTEAYWAREIEALRQQIELMREAAEGGGSPWQCQEDDEDFKDFDADGFS